MKRIFLCILSVFTLLSCRNSDNRFSLNGEFKHLQQGEFYIYSPEGVLEQLDTIKLINGSFEYQTDVKEPTTLMLLYPNFAEHPIFAQNGDNVKIKADARKLGETDISGTKENEDMTHFRMEVLKKSDKQKVLAAENFIRKNPTSRVSDFLFHRFFFNNPNRDIQKTHDLYFLLTKAQPDNMRLKTIRQNILGLAESKNESILPDFKLKCLNGDSLCREQLKGKPSVISFWAYWRSCGYVIYQTRKLNHKYKGKVNFIAYSLDINSKHLSNNIKRDSVSWPVYCDYMAWDNAWLNKMNIPDIPYHILVDANLNIVKRGNDLNKDIVPELKKLIEK